MQKDINQIRLDIYESCKDGEITESQRDYLLEKTYVKEMQDFIMEKESNQAVSSMTKNAAIVSAAIAASIGLIAVANKFRSLFGVKSKIKNSKELTDINNNIKKCSDSLKKSYKELCDIIKQYQTDIHDSYRRSRFYGNRVTSNVHYDYINNQTIASTQINPLYDREKSEEERKKAENLEKTKSKYDEQLKKINEQIRELKNLQRRFLSLVRKNAPIETYEEISNDVSKIMKKNKL